MICRTIFSEEQNWGPRTWKGSDEAATKKFETFLPGEKLFKCDKTTEDPISHRKCGESWFRRVTSSDTKESSSQSANAIITGLESGQSSFRAQVCVSFPNVAKALHAGQREKYIQEHKKAEVVTFLDAFCPAIVKEDVMNNNAFITTKIHCAHAHFHYYQELHQAYTQQMVGKGRATMLSEKLKVVHSRCMQR